MAYKQNSPQSVSEGGTGASTLTGVLTGNGTSAITANTITQYGVLIGGASNAVDSTAVGTAGQVLTSNGAGVAPTYQDTNSAGLIFVESKTATGASIEFTDLVSGQHYKMLFTGVYGANSVGVSMLFSDDNGTTYYTDSIRSAANVYNAFDSNVVTNYNSATDIRIVSSVSNSRWANGEFDFRAGSRMSGYGQYTAANTTATLSGRIHFESLTGARVINAIKFSMDSGNFAGGTFTLYTYKRS